MRIFPQGQHNGTTPYFFTRAHLGSVREVLSGGGTVVARYDYDPFGRSTTILGTTPTDMNFTGLYRHSKSNLDLAVYRAYDPDLGRWLNRDPLKDAEISQGPNLYAYVGNGPINAIDPTGEGEIPAWIPFGGGGRICNDTSYPIRVMVAGGYRQLLPRECTGWSEDADGWWDACGTWHNIYNGNGTTRASSNVNPWNGTGPGGPKDRGRPTNDRPFGGGSSSW